jgi:hypothetical protein
MIWKDLITNDVQVAVLGVYEISLARWPSDRCDSAVWAQVGTPFVALHAQRQGSLQIGWQQVGGAEAAWLQIGWQ